MIVAGAVDNLRVIIVLHYELTQVFLRTMDV